MFPTSDIDQFLTSHPKLYAWRRDIYPGEWYLSNLRSHWIQADTEENWRERGNPEYSPTDITYVTNRHGFRMDAGLELSLESGWPTVLCFGDSYTFGIGLPDRELWVNHLRQRHDALNLGVPGFSSEGVARLVHQLLPKTENPKAVIAVFPDIDRREVYSDQLENSPKRYIHRTPSKYKPSNLSQLELEAHRVTINHYASFINFVKSWTLVAYACESAGVPLTWTTWDPRLLNLTDDVLSCYVDVRNLVRLPPEVHPGLSLARDGLHPGRDFHRWLADRFLERLS